MPETIRVVIADDHMVLRAGLKSVLAIEPDITVIAEVANGRDAVSYAERLLPDVVVMDLSMPEMNGVEATKEIAARVPKTRVLVLTVHSEDECIRAAMDAGASGYLVKSEADREIANAIRVVARGERYASPSGVRALARARAIDASPERQRYLQLTDREKSVLRMIGEGYSASEIGTRLGINPKTVETYRHRIQDKLSLHHRSEYVQFALRAGLLGGDYSSRRALPC